MNVSPADFDGDGCLDVLIATESQNAASPVVVHVYWGNLQQLGIGRSLFTSEFFDLHDFFLFIQQNWK